MERTKLPIRRCAIYTRKSSEEGLEQDFNSLHAQREACESFIRSQAGENWRLVKTAYDDGGLSGGNMERPALKRLLGDIRSRLIDVVVVYKVDRLTRSLADFAKMVEVFDAHQASFVAVTQQFNTTSSMGRLTLNVLLSFAQFEREVTGERIRDKIAASKRKGMWMGGVVSLGYEVKERRLIINQDEAATVRRIFQRYLDLGSVKLLKADLDCEGIVSKVRTSRSGARSGGRPFSRGALYELLANPVYVAEIRHGNDRYPGQHEPIVDRQLWEAVQQRLSERAARNRGQQNRLSLSLLIGKIFDENGELLTPSHAVKHKRRYRYYVSRGLLNGKSTEGHRGWRLPAIEIEKSVAAAVYQLLGDQAALARALQQAEVHTSSIPTVFKTGDELRTQLQSPSDPPLTLAKLIKRVELRDDGLGVSISLPIPRSQAVDDSLPSEIELSRFVPMKMKRRGVELRLIIGGESATARPTDQVLLKAVARAHKWFEELSSHPAASLRGIARREGIAESYVRRLIPLAFLEPQIVEAIIDGRQPVTLTVETMTRGTPLPADWAAQRQILLTQ